MPKPVLSDSLFNADDVATAIIAEANLQVANSNLGVTNVSSDFNFGSGFAQNQHDIVAFKFNGFVFVNATGNRGAGTPASGDVFIETSVSALFPAQTQSAPNAGSQGDTSNTIRFNTDGTFTIHDPTNVGSNTYHVNINAFYRIN